MRLHRNEPQGGLALAGRFRGRVWSAVVSTAPRAVGLVRWATPRLLLPAALLYLIWLALPYLLLTTVALAAFARLPGRHRRRGTAFALVEATIALIAAVYGLHRQGKRFGPSWHPCAQCGAPIDRPSRAAYCSAACRRYARLRREAAEDPELAEVPF
jgi:hypothetical protein